MQLFIESLQKSANKQALARAQDTLSRAIVRSTLVNHTRHIPSKRKYRRTLHAFLEENRDKSWAEKMAFLVNST